MTDGGGQPPFTVTFSELRVVTPPSDFYLDRDWQTLLFAPLWVFEAVAAVDKKVDDKELAAFKAALARPPPGAFPTSVFCYVNDQYAALSAARARDTRKPYAGIADVEMLLVRYPNAVEANEFRLALVDLARNVAGVSGGGLFGLGAKISAAEAAVITQIRALLHVP